MMQDQTLHNINQNFIDMKTNPYVSPEIESIDMSIEAVLCASGSDSIDFQLRKREESLVSSEFCFDRI